MSDDFFKQTLSLNCEERYDVFLSMVAEERDIWILVDANQQFLINYAEDEDIETLPVWPSEAFAQHYCEALSEKLSPKCIGLPEFFSKWVAGLTSDGIAVSVFPNLDEDLWMMDATELKSDLQEEMAF